MNDILCWAVNEDAILLTQLVRYEECERDCSLAIDERKYSDE